MLRVNAHSIRLKTSTLRVNAHSIRLKTSTLRVNAQSIRLKTSTLRINTQSIRLKTSTLRVNAQSMRLTLPSQLESRDHLPETTPTFYLPLGMVQWSTKISFFYVENYNSKSTSPTEGPLRVCITNFPYCHMSNITYSKSQYVIQDLKSTLPAVLCTYYTMRWFCVLVKFVSKMQAKCKQNASKMQAKCKQNAGKTRAKRN